MPELPEVESIRRYLIVSNIEDTTIERVEVGWSDSIAAPMGDIETFANSVSNRRVGSLDRRGKYLIAPLINTPESASHLVLHMGMTGSLHIRKPNEDSVRYRRAAIFLDDNRRVELNDSRRWARMWAVSEASMAFPRLAPDPWDIASKEFVERIRAKRSRIKPTLLDQSIIAGVGNIYADEALHRTGILPLRRCNRISAERLQQLHTNIIAVLKHAIRFISSHPSEDGSPYVVDAYDERMRITRSSTSRCPDCSHLVTSRRISGRTAYYCPVCQH